MPFMLTTASSNPRWPHGWITVVSRTDKENDKLKLRAKITACTDKKSIVHCIVWSEGVQTADGDVIAVRVSESWMKS